MLTSALATTGWRPDRGIARSQIAQCGRLPAMPFERALQWQSDQATAVASGALPEIVAFIEHPAVYTQGRRGGRTHVIGDLTAPIVDTDRGGEITFHGPGQLVIWPILRLRERGIGIAHYVRGLEQVAIDTAHHFDIESERVAGRPGTWIDNRKLASIGVRIQSGVSRHGLALNCDIDLSWFGNIRACGIEDASATSLTAEAGYRIGVDICESIIRRAVARVFALRLSPIAALGDVGGNP